MNIQRKELISNLNGYLHSLRRLSRNKCDFSARSIESCKSTSDKIFTEHLRNIDSTVLNSKSINLREVESFLFEYLDSNLSNLKSEITHLLVWDIVEYVQHILLNANIDPLNDVDWCLCSLKDDYNEEAYLLVITLDKELLSLNFSKRQDINVNAA